MVREVGERAGEMFVLVEVVKLEGLKVAQKDVARQIGVLQAREVVERLRLRLPKIEAGALLLDEQYALPEKVDVAPLVAKFLDRFLEGRDAANRHSEHLEESLVEEQIGRANV